MDLVKHLTKYMVSRNLVAFQGWLLATWHQVTVDTLTLVLLNCFNCIFRHLKLELLTEFPAFSNEKYYYLWQKYMSKIKLLDQLIIY